MRDLQVVLGAGGGIGGALVGALADQGLPVRAVTRRGKGATPAGVERVPADVTDRAELQRSLEGAAVVYHAAAPRYSRWVREFPPMTAAIADASMHAAAKLILADNLYMYGPVEGPLTESSPTQPTSAKGRMRLAMAEDLLERHRRGDLRVTIGRASDYYGEGGIDSAIGGQLFGGVVRGKRARWIGNPDVLHTEHYLGDIARGLALIGTSDRADGHVWHLPAAPPMTGRDFIGLVDRVAGLEPRFVTTSRRAIRFAGLFVPDIGALGEVMDQWEAPFTSDASAFRGAFGGFVVTPHEDAVERTLVWFREQRTRRRSRGA